MNIRKVGYIYFANVIGWILIAISLCYRIFYYKGLDTISIIGILWLIFHFILLVFLNKNIEMSRGGLNEI